MMYDVSPRMCCYGNNPHVEGECQVWKSLTHVEFFIRVPLPSTLGGMLVLNMRIPAATNLTFPADLASN